MKPLSRFLSMAMCLSAWGIAAALAQSPGESVGNEGPNHRLHQSVSTVLDPEGNPVLRTNNFVQLESGLNYLNSEGVWTASREEFSIDPAGWAVARQGNHQVALYYNLNAEGAVVLVQPDGNQQRSHVYGLAYFDSATGEAVLFAPVKDSQAQVIADNQVIYADAFEGFTADVRYSYTKAGFEQDVILRQQPPSPELFGFDPETTRLEVWTEFVETQEPERGSVMLNPEDVALGAAPLVDEELNFRTMRIGLGRAFKLGSENYSLSFVAKSWNIDPNGRRFLVETVEVDSLAEALLELPAGPEEAVKMKPASNRMLAFKALPLKKRHTDKIQAGVWNHLGKEKLVAMVSRPGVVVDYSTLNTTLTNYTFNANSTYYISGLVTLNGTSTVFEPGAVIKFTNTTSARIEVNTPLTWQGDLYRPIVMTAKDDNSVGETITGSSGSPSGYYANVALKLNAGTNRTFSLQHLRVSNAKTAIAIDQRTGHSFNHVQIVDSETAFNPTSADFDLRNALMGNVVYAFNGSSATGRVTHLTVDRANWLNTSNTFASGNLRLTNSVVSGVTNIGTLTATNKVAFASSGLFASAVGGGSRYLASGSPHRDAGASITTTLAKDFKRMTTFPPLTLTTPTTATTDFAPVVQRDTDTPDLGYHYAALDYLVLGTNGGYVVTNSATVTLREGVVMASDQFAGLLLYRGSTFVSTGKPDALNVFTRYTTIQEGRTANDYGTALYFVYGVGTATNNNPSITIRYTAFEGALSGMYSFYSSSIFYASSITVEDCQSFYASAEVSQLLTVKNSLWWGGTVYMQGTNYYQLNNLTMRKGNFWIDAGTSHIRDSLFDNSNIEIYTTSSTNRNVLFVNTTISSSGTNISCITNSTFTYATGTLGPWYHSSTNTYNAGSQNANLAALYHHTVKTDQTKETNSVVDIGFHYVATDVNGVPLDNDSDGFPDYLEDANGDGSVSSGETSWQSASDFGLKVIITRPKNNSVVH